MNQANTIRGAYLDACGKRAYATEALAKGQLRLLQARGRTERSVYKCKQCSLFHLSHRDPATNYALEATRSIEVNGTTIAISRKVGPTGASVSLMTAYTKHDGERKRSVYNMTREEGVILLDALIEALYDNSE